MNERDSTTEALTSWKEIAAYLGRSVRTVRRWEATEGLPVRRHRHRKASTVFAYREEIEAWRDQRQERDLPALAELQAPAQTQAQASETGNARPRPSGFLLAWRPLSAAAGLVAIGLALGWLARGAAQAPDAEAVEVTAAASSNADLKSLQRGALEEDVLNGVVRLCHVNPQEPDCLLLQESVAQLRPDEFRANYEAAFALAAHGANLDRAESYSKRAGALLSERIVSEDAEAAAWILLFEARRSWASGDARGTLASAAELESTLASWPPRLRNLLARDLGTLALALGRTDEARAWFEHISDLDFRHEMLAWHLFASGQKDQLMTHLAQDAVYREPFTAILLAMVGRSAGAEEMIDRLERQRLSSSQAALARGAIAFFSGRKDEAVGGLEATLDQMKESGYPIFFAGSDILAMARAEQGDLDGAIEALEMTQRQRDRAMFWSAGIHWLMCQSRLAGLYEASGRQDLRRSTDDEIRERLRFADDGFPVLAAVSKRSLDG